MQNGKHMLGMAQACLDHAAVDFILADALGRDGLEPGIGSVVVGTLNPAHLRANVAAVEGVLSQPAVSDPVGIAAG